MKREMPLHCSFHCTGLLSPNDAANPVLPYSAIYRMTAEIQLLSFPRHHCTAMNDGAMRLRVRISVHQPRRQCDDAVPCLISGSVLVIPGLAAAACNAAGNLIGSRIVTDHGALVVRPVILVVLVLLLLRVLRVCQMESPSGSEQKEA